MKAMFAIDAIGGLYNGDDRRGLCQKEFAQVSLSIAGGPLYRHQKYDTGSIYGRGISCWRDSNRGNCRDEFVDVGTGIV